MGTDSFERAFRMLFEKRAASLQRYLRILSGDHGLADDVVQECFIRLYRRGSMPDSPQAWLVTVAHNLLRADAGALSAKRIAPARRALALLAERDRQLLLLRHVGYEYREIGEILSLAPSGIGTMLARAGEAFRKIYEGLDRASQRG